MQGGCLLPSTIQYNMLKFTFLYYSAEVLCLFFSFEAYMFTTLCRVYNNDITILVRFRDFPSCKVAGVIWVFFWIQQSSK